MAEDNCLVCGSDMRGEPIPEEYLRKGYYGEWDGVTPQYFSRKIGVNIPGVYDGTLYWMCPDCGSAWHRFPENSVLGFKAQPFIDAVNMSRSLALSAISERENEIPAT